MAFHSGFISKRTITRIHQGRWRIIELLIKTLKSQEVERGGWEKLNDWMKLRCTFCKILYVPRMLVARKIQTEGEGLPERWRLSRAEPSDKSNRSKRRQPLIQTQSRSCELDTRPRPLTELAGWRYTRAYFEASFVIPSRNRARSSSLWKR